VVVVAYLSLSGSGREVGWGGRLLTFSAFRMGAYSRWALIRDWALIRINTIAESKENNSILQIYVCGLWLCFVTDQKLN